MAIDPPSPQNLNDWAKDFDQIAADIAGTFPDQATRLKIYGQGSRNWASIGPFIVAPAPITPKITKITVGSDSNGQRIDFDTDSPVQTYGHDTWVSQLQDPKRRTFDLTFLAPNVDVPIKVTWTDGTFTNRVVHTGAAPTPGKAALLGIFPLPAPKGQAQAAAFSALLGQPINHVCDGMDVNWEVGDRANQAVNYVYSYWDGWLGANPSRRLILTLPVDAWDPGSNTYPESMGVMDALSKVRHATQIILRPLHEQNPTWRNITAAYFTAVVNACFAQRDRSVAAGQGRLNLMWCSSYDGTDRAKLATYKTKNKWDYIGTDVYNWADAAGNVTIHAADAVKWIDIVSEVGDGADVIVVECGGWGGKIEVDFLPAIALHPKVSVIMCFEENIDSVPLLANVPYAIPALKAALAS